MDEEFGYYLNLTFNDTAAAKKKMILDLQEDSLIVCVELGFASQAYQSNEKSNVKGKIKIIRWKHDEVRIRENVKFTDHIKNRKKRFYGKRTFKQKCK